MKFGIVHEWIQAGRPQQNGRHERMHRTLKEDTTKPPASSIRAEHSRFDNCRYVFNNERTHEGLKNAVQPVSIAAVLSDCHAICPSSPTLKGSSAKNEKQWRHQLAQTRTFIGEVFRFGELALERTTPGFYKVYFGDLRSESETRKSSVSGLHEESFEPR
jgi:hypothetical protein